VSRAVVLEPSVEQGHAEGRSPLDALRLKWAAEAQAAGCAEAAADLAALEWHDDPVAAVREESEEAAW